MSRILLFLAIFPASLLAYSRDYAPFRPGHEPRGWRLEEMTKETFDDEGGTNTFSGRSGMRLHFARYVSAEGNRIYAWLSADGVQMMKGVLVSDFYYFPRDAYVSDLNGDGRDDFVAWLPSGGNGLAAQIWQRVIFYSNRDRYEVDSRRVYDADTNDFLDLGHRSATIVRTMFLYGDRGRDRRIHNYWVYTLDGFISGRLTDTNSRLPGFPKWIMYTYGANHDATRQLTHEQKERLWREATSRPEMNSPHRPEENRH